MKEFRPISELLMAALPTGGDIPAAAGAQRRLAERWRAFWRRPTADAERQSPHDMPFNCRPLLFTSGRLVVFVEAAAWGTEIRHQSGALTADLAAHGIHVTAIEVKVRPDAATPI